MILIQALLIFRGVLNSKCNWFSEVFQNLNTIDFLILGMFQKSDFKCHSQSWLKPETPQWTHWIKKIFFKHHSFLRFSKSKCHSTFGLVAFRFWKPQKIHGVWKKIFKSDSFNCGVPTRVSVIYKEYSIHRLSYEYNKWTHLFVQSTDTLNQIKYHNC